MQTSPDSAPDTNSASDRAEGTDGLFDDIDLSTQPVSERIADMVEGTIAMLPNAVLAIGVILFFWLIGTLVRAIIRKTANTNGRHDLGLVLGGFVRGVLIVLGVALALTVLAPSLSIGSLVSSLGIGSLAVGFAFKDILQNWLAGLLILLREPFKIGDQIEVKDYEGTVEHIETRATLIRTYDGQQVVIPNSDVYTNAVTVRTDRDIRRSHYDVGVGYSTDLDEARKIALDVMRSTDRVLKDPEPEALSWELAGSGVDIRLRWWTNSARSDVVQTRAAVIEGIKHAYDEARIDIPYETNVILFHDQTDTRDGRPGKQFEGWPKPRGESDIRPVREASTADERDDSDRATF